VSFRVRRETMGRRSETPTPEKMEAQRTGPVCMGPWEESEEYQRGQAWAIVGFFALLVSCSAGVAAWKGDWHTVSTWLWVVASVAGGCAVWSFSVLACSFLFSHRYRLSRYLGERQG